jgi:hypothetical protein
MRMRSTAVERAARVAGAVIGMSAAALIVVSARPAANLDGMTAAVRFSVPLSGELAVRPAAPREVLVARSLRPGGPRPSGGFEVRNQTGDTLALGFRAHPSSTALDGLLRLRLRVAGHQRTTATLQGMRRGSAPVLRLPPAAARHVEVQAWIPRDAGDGYEGQRLAVSLIPTIAPRGG